MAAISFSDLGLDPVALRVGSFAVRWYGLAYVAGFVVGAFVLRAVARRWKVPLSTDDVLDIVLWCVVALVVGARIGYVVFYGVGEYWADPLKIFALEEGGMSFHGGLAGLLLTGAVLAKRKGVPFLRLADLGAVAAPLGVFFGRLANFVNGELWGRPTDVPWAFIPSPGDVPRHPSQLYEAVLEGLVIFVVLFWLSRRKRPDGFYIGMLMVLYGVFRTFVEFFREPDEQLGFVLGPLTMGQLLTIPMIGIGGWLVWRALRRGRSGDSEGGTAGRDGAEAVAETLESTGGAGV
jgi:phosphatidylglycerol:prolipoprotein diacylglycerol transferase